MAEYIKREAAMNIAFKSPFFSDSLMEEIKVIQSADVAPVRHGRWMKKHDVVMYWRQCSECGNIMPRNFYGNEWNSPYCPNCGAKMDGGEDQ